MKQIEIKTGKATLSVINLPEGKTPREFKMCCGTVLTCSESSFITGDWGDTSFSTELRSYSLKEWQYLGPVRQIIDEIWQDIMPSVPHPAGFLIRLYRNYTIKDSLVLTQSATESGLSLLQANGILLNNKYQDDWDELCQWGHGDFSKDGKSSYELYTEEQAKVWTNPHIFIKQK